MERKLCSLETTRILFTTILGGFLLPCVPTLIHTYFVCGNTYLLCVRKKYLMTVTTESAHDLIYSEWMIVVSQLPYKDIRNGCLEECYKCH